MSEWIWLNHHRKSPPSPEFVKEFSTNLKNYWDTAPFEQSYQQLSQYLGLGKWSFYAGIGQALSGLYFHHYKEFIRATGRSHVLMAKSEKGMLCEAIQHCDGLEIDLKEVPVNECGQMTKELVQPLLQARTGLLSLQWANPFTGVIQPVHDLIALCRENDVQVHVDISCALGKLSPLGLEADYLTIDGALLQLPLPFGAVLAKDQLENSDPSYSIVHSLKSGIAYANDQMMTYALQVAHLRSQLEKEIQELGGHLFFQKVERLPNTCLFAFEGIHADSLLTQLKHDGIIATNGGGTLAQELIVLGFTPALAHSCISVALNETTTQEMINQTIASLKKSLDLYRKRQSVPFSHEDAKEKNMRAVSASLKSPDESKSLTFHLLVDEEDGVIADCYVELFGPASLEKTAWAAADLLLRKNYMQAKRLSAELIAQKSKDQKNSHVNFVLDVIDEVTEKCLDIPIEDVYMAPPEMDSGEQTVYPGWETLTNEQKKSVIAQVIEKEIQPYVELDAGGVEVKSVEDNRVLIAYSGNCTSCFSATGATLDAIGNILRRKIFPDLMVTPDMSLLQLS